MARAGNCCFNIKLICDKNFSLQLDSVNNNFENLDEAITQSSGILCRNHSNLVSLKLRSFLSSDSSDDLENIETGRDILKLADILEPGYSLIREKLQIKLGVNLQEYIGLLLMELMSSQGEDNQDTFNLLDDLLLEAEKLLVGALESSK